ncbi:MAG: hypothetical protein ACRDIA_08325, partial [Actinomycetota bacterium]
MRPFRRRKTILARYESNGNLDPTFGQNGLAIYDFDPPAANHPGKEAAAAVMIDPGPDYKTSRPAWPPESLPWP